MRLGLHKVLNMLEFRKRLGVRDVEIGAEASKLENGVVMGYRESR